MIYASRRAFSVDAYVRRHFGRVTVSGDERVVACPWCVRDKCYWNVRKGVFVCFRCGVRGTSFAFVREHLKASDAEVARVMTGEAYGAGAAAYDPDAIRRLFRGSVGGRLEFESASGPAGEAPPAALPPEYHQLPHDSVLGRDAWTYLERRGVTAEQVVTHRIGFAARGRYAGYIILPVLQGGALVYYVGRAFKSAGRRYLNPPNGATPSTASEVLFNLDVAALFGAVTLVEGYFDALAEGVAGVAMFGKVLSVAQLARLIATAGPHVAVTVKLDDDVSLAASMTLARQVMDAGFASVTVTQPVGDPAERRGDKLSVAYSFGAYIGARCGGG